MSSLKYEVMVNEYWEWMSVDDMKEISDS